MIVSVAHARPAYPTPPFHPSEQYPEYGFAPNAISNTPNEVYAAVRKTLYRLGLDAQNYGTSAWNPLGELIQEGCRVILKPNFVNHYNPLSEERAYFEALVTQGAVIRPLVDYILIASKGNCTLVFADLPIQSADFETIVRQTGLDQVIEFARASSHGNMAIDLLDLRDFRLVTTRSGAIIKRVQQPGDPLGYVEVDLAKSSSLVPLEKYASLFRVPDYNSASTVRTHSDGLHQYIFPRTVLNSDVFINVPKLKVHRKVGVTLCLKNLVGIIGDKSCLPHFRAGAPPSGGDEFAFASPISELRSRYDFSLRRSGRLVWSLIHPFGHWLVGLNHKLQPEQNLSDITGGDWYGNDTAWRMVHDINRILLYADSEGILHDKPQRRYFALVDGIIAGEREGPLSPSPVPGGVVVAGFDPLAVDICCTRLMGLDWRKIPMLANCEPGNRYRFSEFSGDPQQIGLIQSDDRVLKTLERVQPIYRFTPTDGWKGHIELEDAPLNL